jgi:alpha-1,6-mannosyltransferase
MFRLLPPELGAAMVLIGDGKLRAPMAAAAKDLPIAFPGFEHSRSNLARALASSDIFVTAAADETFGVSVLEAQACALPVVGVRSGAMPDRVRWDLGRLGPVDDVDAMAENVLRVWQDDPRAMGVRARRMVADRFSWERSFATLFDEIYPAAIARASERREEEQAYLFPDLHSRLSMPG